MRKRGNKICQRGKMEFNTRLKLEDKVLEQVHSKKLLGLIITDDLTLEGNTASLMEKASSRMIILKNNYVSALWTKFLLLPRTGSS